LLVVVVAEVELVLEGVVQEVEVPEVPVEVVPVQANLELLPALRERLIREVVVAVVAVVILAVQESSLFNIQNKEVKYGTFCTNWLQ
jgi:hypothetical protein